MDFISQWPLQDQIHMLKLVLQHVTTAREIREIRKKCVSAGLGTHYRDSFEPGGIGRAVCKVIDDAVKQPKYAINGCAKLIPDELKVLEELEREVREVAELEKQCSQMTEVLKDVRVKMEERVRADVKVSDANESNKRKRTTDVEGLTDRAEEVLRGCKRLKVQEVERGKVKEQTLPVTDSVSSGHVDGKGNDMEVPNYAKWITPFAQPLLKIVPRNSGS